MADFVDFLPSVWKYATADAGIQALGSGPTFIGSTEYASGIIGKDADPAPYEFDPPNNRFGWIFRDIGDQRPPRNVEGTGKAAILFSQWEHWSNQVRHHTTKFPILTVFIFADVTRHAVSNAPIAQDAEAKVRRVWREIDRLFHDAANRVHTFDTLRIVSSVESSPLSILDIPDGDGAVRGTVRYDITL